MIKFNFKLFALIVEEFELLFAVVYRSGTNGFMSGESPILRPIPGHEDELEFDVITGLRTRINIRNNSCCRINYYNIHNLENKNIRMLI